MLNMIIKFILGSLILFNILIFSALFPFQILITFFLIFMVIMVYKLGSLLVDELC